LNVVPLLNLACTKMQLADSDVPAEIQTTELAAHWDDEVLQHFKSDDPSKVCGPSDDLPGFIARGLTRK
jgi:hypothetical protein